MENSSRKSFPREPRVAEPAGNRASSVQRRRPVPAYKRQIARWRGYAIKAVTVILGVGCVLGLVWFLRPTMSPMENRNLTPFPEFQGDTFLSGEFFTDASLWYADTYPFRDALVGASRGFKGLYGIEPQTQLIGGNRQSDELPVPGDENVGDTEAATDDSAKPEAGEGGRAQVTTADMPEVRFRAQEMEDQITDGVYVENGACYTLYYFDQDATQAYADVINSAADQLEGVATVYSVLLPTNAGVMLSDDTLAALGVPNQEQAIDYFYSLMDDNVVTVETYDVLSNHKDEYLYFRTDHHWTQLAAYYVYTSLCAARGVEPAPYNDGEKDEFSPFWGEYDGVATIRTIAEPDYVIARVPQGTNEMEYWTDDLDESTRMDGPVITDLSDAGEDDNKYNCFVCGNRPLSHIHNPKVTDGSSCLIIKDSYGNPFVSVMVDDYEDIYTMDFRYSSLNIIDFVKEHNIKDVVFENVIMFAGTYNCSDSLALLIDPENEYRCDFEFSGVNENGASSSNEEGKEAPEGEQAA